MILFTHIIHINLIAGHVEVYDFVFDGNEDTYEQLVRHFFMFHDPTTLNKQGNDAGTQYASVLYCYDAKQVPYRYDIPLVTFIMRVA